MDIRIKTQPVIQGTNDIMWAIDSVCRKEPENSRIQPDNVAINMLHRKTKKEKTSL